MIENHSPVTFKMQDQLSPASPDPVSTPFQNHIRPSNGLDQQQNLKINLRRLEKATSNSNNSGQQSKQSLNGGAQQKTAENFGDAANNSQPITINVLPPKEENNGFKKVGQVYTQQQQQPQIHQHVSGFSPTTQQTQQRQLQSRQTMKKGGIPPMPTLLLNSRISMPIPSPPALIPKASSIKVDGTPSSFKKVSIQENVPESGPNSLHTSGQNLRSSLKNEELGSVSNRSERKRISGTSNMEMGDPYEIKINIRNFQQSAIPIPNSKVPILEQAKQFIYENQTGGNPTIKVDEEGLTYAIEIIHSQLNIELTTELKQKLQESSKKLLQVENPQNPSSQSGVKNSEIGFGETTREHLQLLETEEIKRLKDENQEQKMKVFVLETDLQYQATKTKDLQRKYESDLDNLRNQLKGSQTEQFLKQQTENKKLMEDNATLMKEISVLTEKLDSERSKVIQLFEDAILVREEIQKEIDYYEKLKKKFIKLQKENFVLKAKYIDKQDINLEDLGSDFDFLQEGLDSSDSSQEDKREKRRQSKGISPDQSLESIGFGLISKLEGMIDAKSKSVADTLTKNQLSQMYGGLYYHPYALNQHLIYQQQMQKQNELKYQRKGTKRSSKKKIGAGNVVELYLQESAGEDFEEEKKNEDSYVLKGAGIKDISALRQKILEMKERHDSMIKSSSIHRDKSTSSLDQLSRGRPPYQSHFINQSQKQLNDMSLKGVKNASLNQNLFNYQSIAEIGGPAVDSEGVIKRASIQTEEPNRMKAGLQNTPGWSNDSPLKIQKGLGQYGQVEENVINEKSSSSSGDETD